MAWVVVIILTGDGLFRLWQGLMSKPQSVTIDLEALFLLWAAWFIYTHI